MAHCSAKEWHTGRAISCFDSSWASMGQWGWGLSTIQSQSHSPPHTPSTVKRSVIQHSAFNSSPSRGSTPDKVVRYFNLSRTDCRSLCEVFKKTPSFASDVLCTKVHQLNRGHLIFHQNGYTLFHKQVYDQSKVRSIRNQIGLTRFNTKFCDQFLWIQLIPYQYVLTPTRLRYKGLRL